MGITVLYTDLRRLPSRLERQTAEWRPALTAFEALQLALGPALAREIEKDLLSNSREVMVPWWNKDTDDHSEIGGVGSLDWTIADGTVVTVNYENQATTQQQIDEAIEWTLEQKL